MKKYLITCTLSTLAATAIANDHSLEDVAYIGGALNHNIIDSPFGGRDLDANGYSIFGGYKFENSITDLMTAVEFGYSDTGDFDVSDNNRDEDINGIWVAAVAEKSLPEIDSRLSVVGRGGLDLGDDDGIFLGAGAGFKVNQQLGLRAEFINKDVTSVYQISALFHF